MEDAINNDNLIIKNGFINGNWVNSNSEKTFSVKNPATGEVITEVPDMGEADTKEAIKAAHKALKKWRKLTGKERGQMLKNWHKEVVDNIDELALLLTMEQGKSLQESKAEVLSSAAFIDWFSAEAMRIVGDVLPESAPGRFEYVRKEPVGVVAAITPWNFPSSMIARKVAPALAAGCTVVAKPAEDTPLSALALVFLAEKAGIPAGVINIVTASHGSEVGGELCKNPIVKKLSFTGSTAVGKFLMSQCSETVKKLSLELGGNAPFIVFDDADIDAAVAGVMAIKFYNNGQTCICANRIIIHEKIHDLFISKLSNAIENMVIGDGRDEKVTHGPLINKSAIDKISNLVTEAKDNGAKVVTGGKVAPEIGENFYLPTLLTNLTSDMNIFSCEIFGPIAAIYTFKDEEDAIQLANSTPYGLSAYLYTNDYKRILSVTKELEYGMVGVNTPKFVSETVPFGGVKESGIGREGSHYGIEEFLEMHYVCIASN